MKTVLNYAAIVTFLFAFLGTSTISAQEWTKDQKELWKTIENAWAKWQEGDLDAVFENIHEKYLGWNQDDPLPTSKAKWFKSAKIMMEHAKLAYYDIEPARILVYNDVAVVHYYYEQKIEYTKEGETTHHSYKGKNAEFCIKEGGKWMLIGDMSVWKSKH